MKLEKLEYLDLMSYDQNQLSKSYFGYVDKK